MTWEQLCELAGALPGVTVERWYGTPALKVRGKGFVRLKEDRATVVFMLDGLDAQDALIDAFPATYFITDHYKGYPTVLARLAKLSPRHARERLEHAWRQKAGAALIAAHEAADDGKPDPRARLCKPGSRSRFREVEASRRRATGRNSRRDNEEIAESAKRGGSTQASSGVRAKRGRPRGVRRARR